MATQQYHTMRHQLELSICLKQRGIAIHHSIRSKIPTWTRKPCLLSLQPITLVYSDNVPERQSRPCHYPHHSCRHTPVHEPHSRLGPNATRLNLSSPAPASCSRARKPLTPMSSALSLSTSSSSANVPRFSGPFRLPSSSQRLF